MNFLFIPHIIIEMSNSSLDPQTTRKLAQTIQAFGHDFQDTERSFGLFIRCAQKCQSFPKGLILFGNLMEKCAESKTHPDLNLCIDQQLEKI